jgi:hypothetical protein
MQPAHRFLFVRRESSIFGAKFKDPIWSADKRSDRVAVKKAFDTMGAKLLR